MLFCDTGLERSPQETIGSSLTQKRQPLKQLVVLYDFQWMLGAGCWCSPCAAFPCDVDIPSVVSVAATRAFRERKESQNAPVRHIARDCLHSASTVTVSCRTTKEGTRMRRPTQPPVRLEPCLENQKWDQRFLWERTAIQTSCGATSSRELLLSRRHGQDLLGTVRDGQNITFCLRSC